MPAYQQGTIFESAQTFPPNSSFGDGCLFPDGCTFQNPCTFGEGCIFGKGCKLLRSDPRQPPHQTGAGCVFDAGCVIDWTVIGEANIIQDPAQYSPVSQGADTLVGQQNESALPENDVTATGCLPCGMVVSGTKVSDNWCDVSKSAGFDADDATIRRAGDCPDNKNESEGEDEN